MSNTVSVKVTWNDSEISKIGSRSMKGLFRMGYDIANNARARAPYLTGALRNTIRVVDVGRTTLEVIAGGVFNGYNVPYAWIREQGPNRNPATVHYMRNAKDDIMSGDYMKKYFGDITK